MAPSADSTEIVFTHNPSVVSDLVALHLRGDLTLYVYRGQPLRVDNRYFPKLLDEQVKRRLFCDCSKYFENIEAPEDITSRDLGYKLVHERLLVIGDEPTLECYLNGMFLIEVRLSGYPIVSHEDAFSANLGQDAPRPLF